MGYWVHVRPPSLPLDPQELRMTAPCCNRYNQLPTTSETGQSGTNACGTTSSQTSLCQTMYMNDADDFCLWAPTNYTTIGDAERDVVAYCTKAGRGTRLIPDGTLQGVHFVRTVDYVQVTGVGNFTNINVDGSDGGGELDPHGADGNGNPIGGLVFGSTFGSNLQYHEWTKYAISSILPPICHVYS